MAVTLDKVFHAQTILKNIIRETSVVRAYGIAPQCKLYLKPENLQITGSFKVRGSAYKIAMLSEEETAKVVEKVLKDFGIEPFKKNMGLVMRNLPKVDGLDKKLVSKILQGILN